MGRSLSRLTIQPGRHMFTMEIFLYFARHLLYLGSDSGISMSQLPLRLQRWARPPRELPDGVIPAGRQIPASI